MRVCGRIITLQGTDLFRHGANNCSCHARRRNMQTCLDFQIRKLSRTFPCLSIFGLIGNAWSFFTTSKFNCKKAKKKVLFFYSYNKFANTVDYLRDPSYAYVKVRLKASKNLKNEESQPLSLPG